MRVRIAAVGLLLLQPAQAVAPCCLLPQAANHENHAGRHAGSGHDGALVAMPPGAPCESAIERSPALRERLGDTRVLALPEKRTGFALERTCSPPLEQSRAQPARAPIEGRFPLRL